MFYQNILKVELSVKVSQLTINTFLINLRLAKQSQVFFARGVNLVSRTNITSRGLSIQKSFSSVQTFYLCAAYRPKNGLNEAAAAAE